MKSVLLSHSQYLADSLQKESGLVMHMRHTEKIIKPMVNRRNEIRFLINEPVTVTLLETDRTVSGITVDVSETGLSFRSIVQLPVNSTVKVEFGGVMVLGEIRYCQARPDNTSLEYVSGVGIDQIVFGWKEFYTATCQASYSVSGRMQSYGGSPQCN